MSRRRLTNLAVLALIAVPPLLLVNTPTFSTTKAWLTYASLVAGYIGVNLLLMQLILGARNIARLISPDLAANLKLHIWMGKWGSLLIFAHPVLLILGAGYDWLILVEPDLSSEFGQHVSLGRLAFYMVLTVWFTSAIVRKRIKFRPWKLVHYLAYLALIPALLHAFQLNTIDDSNPGRVYFAVVGVATVLALIIRLGSMFGFGKTVYRVVANDPISDTVSVIRMKPAGKALHPQPGQYVYIQPKLLAESHPFSVLRHDSQTGEIELGYRVYGKFTEQISRLQAGSDVNLDGPYGQFTREAAATQRNVYISGGIGITPFVQSVLGSNDESWLFNCQRQADILPYDAELSAHKSGRYVKVLADADPGEGYETGYFSKDILSKYIQQPTGYTYFICGPPAMMTAVKQQLIELGIPVGQIHTEEFSF